MARNPELPAAQIYLITPRLAAAAPFDQALTAALAAGPIACVLLRFSTDDPSKRKMIARALAPLAQSAGAALLLEDDPQLAARAGADGVHMKAAAGGLDEALDAMKPERIVGVGPLPTRDECMQAGELEIDYLTFGGPDEADDAPTILSWAQWWAEIFNVPCVAYAHRLQDVAPLAEAGVEFVALETAVWDAAQGPAAAVGEVLRLSKGRPA